MSIKDRIRRLEGRGEPACTECRLRPARTYLINPDGEEDRPIPEPEHCPECGSAIELVVIRLVYEGRGEGA